MEITEIFNILNLSGIAGVIILLGIFIKIPKVELNIWQWLASSIGKAFNKELLNKIDLISQQVDIVEKKLSQHIELGEEEKMRQARQRILRFNDELVSKPNVHHTYEHYNEIISDIDMYENYCINNPNYPNNKAVMAIENLKHVYKETLENHAFSNGGKKL